MESKGMTVASLESGSTLSPEEIRVLVEPAEARTRRTARAVTLWLLISGAAIATLVSGLGAYQDKSMTSETLAMGVMVFLFFGLLTALAARYLILRDLRWIPGLVRDGKTIPGKLASHRVVANGVHQLVVIWTEDSEEVGAHFDVDQLRGVGNEAQVTIVSSGRDQVGVVLNGQLFLAVRNTPRFFRWKAQQPSK